MPMTPKRPTRYGHKSHLTTVPRLADQDTQAVVIAPLLPTVHWQPTADGGSESGVRRADVVMLVTPAPAIVAVIAGSDITAPGSKPTNDCE